MTNETTPKTALLVIDVQDSFAANQQYWKQRNNPNFEETVTGLIEAFRSKAMPIFFVLHSADKPAFRRDSPAYKVMDFVNFRPDDTVIHKTTRSALVQTDLDSRLRALDVERLVISGIQTEQCCETTARHGADLGYEIDFVTEATATFPIRHWETGVELSADLITERTEYALAERFATIVTVDEAVDRLG